MSLLKEIQDAAIDNRTPVATLLRKCAVLAARLGNEDLRRWVANELNGYERETELPPYRVVPSHAVGNLAGPFGSGYQGITIPSMLLPEKLRDYAERLYLKHPISALESYIDIDEDKGILTSPWPGDLVAMMQDKFNGLVLYGAWQTLPRAGIIGLVDTVRNRVLEFALQLERDAPAAGDEQNAADTVPDARVSQLYQTIIYAGVVGNVATSSHAIQTVNNISVQQGDVEALKQVLLKWGVPQSDVSELELALKDDPASASLAAKPKTAAWLGKMLQKSLSGTLQLSRGVGINLLAQTIGQFLGIPTIPPL